MSLLVTGGRGLVGSAIAGDFKPTRDELDLMDLESIVAYLNENQITQIIHCAAKVGGIKANMDQLGEFFYANTIINTNVLEAARCCSVEKVVSFMSTCVFPDKATYPLSADQIHDGEPHSSNYAYAYSKRMLDVQSRAYREQYGCNFVTVIPCNIYGPNDNFDLESSHVIPALIRKCDEAINTHSDFVIWGSGEPWREFIFVGDVAEITSWVLNNYNDPAPFIMSPESEVQISTIAQTIASVMGFEGNIVYDSHYPDGQLKKPSDNSVLRELMPDYQFTSIEDGLQQSVHWYKEHKKEITT
ncbi:MAG: GDP-L-fucose synthase [Planctomycetes bacterium]|nr:GDP-L-fucose synthase [Planctomycetota bacterium]MBL6998084.1 GDP-L-fucose synthase [Phycisphaerales bacterium]